MLAHMFVFIVASRLSLITYRWLVEWRSGWIGLGQGNLTVRTERECPLKRPEREAIEWPFGGNGELCGCVGEAVRGENDREGARRGKACLHREEWSAAEGRVLEAQ